MAWWLVGLLALAVFVYWTIIIGEGSYFGPWMVRWIYARGARVYDRVRERVTASDAELLVGPLRAALLSRPLDPALDVATGTGRVPLLLAAEEWYAGAIVGLDLTPAMLAIAREKAAARLLGDRIEWQLGSGDDLSRWPDATFGLVTCLEALEYFGRPRRAVSEMWRLLVPGGTLIISTWTPRHARLLPGKAWTAAGMTALLQSLGCVRIESRPWQSGEYDLVIAVKP
ncbi:MAG TPA: class I SAM-dependent methyltransferase [Herpetosiphonaceae bacterium]|nr:class I SAM-dependent methyltransferase [Herpetosiphonaceae bacterium]